MRYAFPMLGIAVMACLATDALAQRVVIAFNDLSVRTTVTTQYPTATFSSPPGFINITADDHNLGTSRPNYLCTANSQGALNCTADTYVDFATPVNDLSLYAAGDNAAGRAATVRVFRDGILAANLPILVDGTMATPDLVNLTGFGNVTRIELTGIVDPGGLAWDDFSFVPGPPSLAARERIEPVHSLTIDLHNAPASSPVLLLAGSERGMTRGVGQLGTIRLGVTPTLLLPLGTTDQRGRLTIAAGTLLPGATALQAIVVDRSRDRLWATPAVRATRSDG